MPWPPSPLIGSLVVIAAYMLVRSAIYELFPVTTQESWFLRDAIVCIPRLLALVALLYLNRTWRVARMDFPLKGLGRTILWSIAPLALWTFYFSGSKGDSFVPWMIAVGFITSMIVGLFEEYAFRGPLLTTLHQQLGYVGSILISSFLFALFHLQAQPFSHCLMILLTGIILANLRLRGIGLGWLALLHGLIDASAFLFHTQSADALGLHGLAVHAGLLVLALISYPRAIFTQPAFHP
ncbi:MAG TPA: CPBP family intramembrane glutamic endopeptidase [Verrucomicrobiae bacterium]